MTSCLRNVFIINSVHLKDSVSITKVRIQMNAKIQMANAHRVKATYRDLLFFVLMFCVDQ